MTGVNYAAAPASHRSGNKQGFYPALLPDAGVSTASTGKPNTAETWE